MDRNSIKINVTFMDLGSISFLDAMVKMSGAKQTGQSETLVSYQVMPALTEHFITSAELNPSVLKAETDPPSLRAEVAASLKAEREQHIETYKPKLSILHHAALDNYPKRKYSVTDIKGNEYNNVDRDFIFTDGISIVKDGVRIYLPITSILSIKVLNPE